MERFRVAFIVPGEPKGKGRPRFNTKTGRTYTPGDTINYENLVKMQYQALVGDKYTEKEVEARITCYYGITKSIINGSIILDIYYLVCTDHETEGC